MPASPAHLRGPFACMLLQNTTARSAERTTAPLCFLHGFRIAPPQTTAPPKAPCREGSPAKPSHATSSSRRAAGAAGGYRHLPGLVLPNGRSPLAAPYWPARPTPHKHCRVGLLAAPAPIRELPLSHNMLATQLGRGTTAQTRARRRRAHSAGSCSSTPGLKATHKAKHHRLAACVLCVLPAAQLRTGDRTHRTSRRWETHLCRRTFAHQTTQHRCNT